MQFATMVSIIDHEHPENPPYVVLDGASSSETAPLAILNDLSATGDWFPLLQTSFDLTTSGGTATFVETLLERETL